MEENSKNQNQTGKKAVFFKRLTSTAILWTVVLVAIFAPSRTLSLAAFALIALTLTIVGLYEFYNIIEKLGQPCYKSIGIIAGCILTIIGFLKNAFLQTEMNFEPEFVLLGIIVITILAIRLSEPIDSNGLIKIATTIFGIIYVPFLFLFMQKIYFYPKISGQYFLLLFLILTKFSDSGAYIFGSLFGKHKMCPTISPNKTWEGFSGAIILPIVCGLILKLLAPVSLSPISYLQLIMLSIILGATAVIGDLVESVFKREAKVKDSGNLFPGVGGVLDVLDSLLFNAPIMYLFMRFAMSL